MSAKTLLRRTAGVLRGLVVPADPAYATVVDMQFAQMDSQIESLQEIVGEIITLDDPWALEVKTGTCFGGMFTVTERMSKTKHLYRCRQVLFAGDSGTTCHEVIVKCTFLRKDMPPDEIMRETEHVGRDVEAIGAQANCSPYSLELIAGGRLTTPEGATVVLWEAFEVMAGDAKQLAMSLSGTLPPFLAVRLARQMAEVLSIYHFTGGNGTVHRDVKPQNIMFDQPSSSWLSLLFTNFKLGDAQLAKGTPHELAITQAGTTLGTPQYMAPEQAIDAHDVTVQADIWALGVTLFELTTGTLPHSPTQAMTVAGSGLSSQSAAGYLLMVVREEPKLLSRHPGIDGLYPRCFVDLVDRMLSMDPLLRPTSLECLQTLSQKDAWMPLPALVPPAHLAQTIMLPPSGEP